MNKLKVLRFVLTGISGGSLDMVATVQELLHHPRPDEASRSGHTDPVLLVAIGVDPGAGRHCKLGVGVCRR